MAYRLMCITAHPDDECGAFGGALLTAHAAGAETTVICLTEGQAASHRGDAASGAELAELRRTEFAAAGEVLGVSRGEVLHFPDGKLYRHDPTELISVLVERIRQWRPHVVITFGGEGGVNLHRDHTVVSIATTVAFHWAGSPLRLSRANRPRYKTLLASKALLRGDSIPDGPRRGRTGSYLPDSVLPHPRARRRHREEIRSI